MFEKVQVASPDPILGLTEAFKADPSPKKINLGVGVYKDDTGVTPVLESVRKAESRLLEEEKTKAYLPIDGSPEYAKALQELLFGSSSAILTAGRAATSQTPGGTGALRVLGDYLHTQHPESTLWLTTPTWANHGAIFAAAAVPTKSYRYYNEKKHNLDFEGLLASLGDIPAGDVVLLHGCCHNPTGVDPSLGQWQQVAAQLAKQGLLPVIDFAYQGFGVGLDEDAAGLRAVLDACSEAMICSSFSKNFGLYRERVGALTCVAADQQTTQAVQSNVKICIRRNYSNPPAHGGAVVRIVLGDEKLRALWQREVAAMRDRINNMRRTLADALDEKGVQLSEHGNGFIAEQRGMFSVSGLNKEQVQRLRKEFSIYVVGSGRINVAGVTPKNLGYLTEAIASVV